MAEVLTGHSADHSCNLLPYYSLKPAETEYVSPQSAVSLASQLCHKVCVYQSARRVRRVQVVIGTVIAAITTHESAPAIEKVCSQRASKAFTRAVLVSRARIPVPRLSLPRQTLLVYSHADQRRPRCFRQVAVASRVVNLAAIASHPAVNFSSGYRAS